MANARMIHQRLAEVCEILVEDKFGPLAADVFSTLARRGRLLLPQIQQHTEIPGKDLRSTVLTLVNHNVLLWQYTDWCELPHYQVDWHTAYVLVRQNKTTRLVEQRHGKAARQLLHTVMERGKVRVGDLEDEQTFYMASPRDSGIGMADDQASEEGNANGTHAMDNKMNGEEQITTVASFHDTLRSLLADGFLCKGTDRDHLPVAELEEELREEVISADPKTFKDGKTTGPKTAVTFLQAANDLKRKWQDESEYSPQRDVASQGTIKRAKNSDSAINKRRKLDGNLTSGFQEFHDDEDQVEADIAPVDCSVRKLPSDLWLRVNYRKCMIALRTDRLESLADEYAGPMSAAVYGTLLRFAEEKVRSVRSQLRVKTNASLDNDDDDEDQDDEKEEMATDHAEITIADTDILDRVPKWVDLSSIKETSGDLHTKSSASTAQNSKKRRLFPDDDEDVAGVGIKKEVEFDDDEEEEEEEEEEGKEEGGEEDTEPIVNGIESTKHRRKRLDVIATHLDLLGESSSKLFLWRNSEKRTSTINFGVLSHMLVEMEMDQMILARSGQVGLRVVRILRENGKLLDTQIAGMCLKQFKELRIILNNLQVMGVIDVQEVPKDNQRQPSRTIYLWHFNEDEVRQAFLQETYQALSNTLLRLEIEKERHRDITEKAESVDWNMERLTKAERNLYARWLKIEERMSATVDGLDDLVMVLRDFEEVDTSLLS